ncbi:hypothetical protein [uncultured Ruminococcus sp.]|uniref:hypothetical protein n=1 Tax=uncultured Ruminococcus sp. TaxID=165186 RepID=UPI00261A3521|nr:hypothetical protein [uncultured Ruminococcus sp.]
MKNVRILAGVIAFTAALSMFCGCEQQKNSSRNSDAAFNYSLDGGNSNNDNNAIGVLEDGKQPDPLAPTDDNGGSSQEQQGEAETAAEGNNDTESTEDTELKAGSLETETASAGEQKDPLGGGEFRYNDKGAVVFSNSDKEPEDDVKVSAAQALFQSACRTEWAYKFGCPYNMDTSDVIKNEFGWEFARITDPSIKSLADVQRDYCQVFSERYVTGLTDVYQEKDGAVYALAPARGSNVYYSVSKVTSVKSESGDEIVFNVDNYYDGNDKDPNTPYTETTEFSVVVGDDGEWRVGRFTLPY